MSARIKAFLWLCIEALYWAAYGAASLALYISKDIKLILIIFLSGVCAAISGYIGLKNLKEMWGVTK